MLALLIGLLAAAGLLARGGWDVWVQSALFVAVVGGTGAWLLSRVVIGYVPLPPKKLMAWAFALAVLGGLSAYLSPVAAYAIPGWRVSLLGLWVFLAVACVSKDERAGIDQAVRAAGWTLVLLAFYQRYHDQMWRPASALINQNVFAGAILMLLPLAVQQRDLLLSFGLLLCLIWSHSVGAWLGLAAALIWTRKARESVGSYLGMAILFVCLVLIYGKLQDADVVHRWHWWKSAWRMALDRPLLGFGEASYAYVAPMRFDPGLNLNTMFAHQHFLEQAAERGWPTLLLWLGALVYFLRRGAPHKRFGAVAVLVQSFWDYPLSLPGVYWLFCYFCASTTPETSTGVNVPYSKKAPAAAAVLLVCGGACWWAAATWRADILKSKALEAFKERNAPAEAVAGLERSLRLRADPEAERALAEILLDARGNPSREQAQAAAIHLERAARLNPYRPSTWSMLERLHTALGDPDKARALRAEGERYCPPLRAPKT